MSWGVLKLLPCLPRELCRDATCRSPCRCMHTDATQLPWRGPYATSFLPATSLAFADALHHYTQTKAVYQSLEPNQPWL